MSTTRTRADIVAAIEQAGVVAVIRLKDPDKLRAVVDAIGRGGIRGAVAVGVGTALLDPKAIASGDYDVLCANAERIVAGVHTTRG